MIPGRHELEYFMHADDKVDLHSNINPLEGGERRILLHIDQQQPPTLTLTLTATPDVCHTPRATPSWTAFMLKEPLMGTRLRDSGHYYHKER